jgi:hypothetical protein
MTALLLHHPERQHRVRDLLEAGDVRALHIIDMIVADPPVREAALVDSVHDVLQQLLELGRKRRAAVLRSAAAAHPSAAGAEAYDRQPAEARVVLTIAWSKMLPRCGA